MQPFQRAFVDLLVTYEVIRFGSFTLKSGRVSPYFVNAGQLRTGRAISGVGDAYAAALERERVPCDLVFGPAYKGVPLAVATATALSNEQRDVPYGFDRKEVKDHGEGGVIVGAPLCGRVLIIDDVISAGTSVRESLDIISAEGAAPAGVAIALDRQERGTGALSAAQEVQSLHGLPCCAIAGLDDLIRYLESDPESGIDINAIQKYREAYGTEH